MINWAAESTYYHIVIDRFATGKRCFNASSADQNKLTDGNRMEDNWLGGNLQGITQSLDYLQQLGVGAILLTPFFQGAKYHGYWTQNFATIDPHFGDPRQLKQLIKTAHQHDMRVIMDLPLTHCHKESYFAHQAIHNPHSPYRRWFQVNRNGLFSGFYGDSALPEFNLDLPEVIDYLTTVTDYWLSFGVDGIRFDHAKRPSAVFWKQFTEYLDRQQPQVFRLGENWHDSGKIGTLANYLHGELNIPLNAALRRFARQPNYQSMQHIMHQVTAQHTLRNQGYLLPTFLDNHDMERISHVANNNQPIMALCYLIQLTLPYPPIIYYGSERAQQQSNNLAPGHYERDRLFREPMHWHTGQAMAQWVSELIHYRNKHIEWFLSEPVAIDFPSPNICQYSYLQHDTLITVVINFGKQPQSLELSSPSTFTTRAILATPSTQLIKNHGNKNTARLEGYSGAIMNTRHTSEQSFITAQKRLTHAVSNIVITGSGIQMK